MNKILTFLITALYLYSTNVYANNIQPRIINGSQVSPSDDQWRFIVSLRYFDSHYCGGSLIAKNWVLTAAHCVTDNNGNLNEVTADETVGVGSYENNATTLYSIKRFIVHELYDDYTLDNDIALIELNDNTAGITPIAYDKDHNLSAGTLTEIAGWGNMSTRIQDYPINLMEGLVPIVNFQDCNNSYGNLTENMICAGYMDGTRDSCQGDSGGPLIAFDNDEWKQVGIVSWGYNCAQVDYPGVYTKVQNYTTWIESYTGSLDTQASISPIIMYLLD